MKKFHSRKLSDRAEIPQYAELKFSFTFSTGKIFTYKRTLFISEKRLYIVLL